MNDFKSGTGGSLAMAGGGTLHVTTWTINKIGINADTTNSGGDGWKSRIPVLKDWNGSCDCPWDDDNIPEGIGFDISDTAVLTATVGASGKAYTGTCIITNVKPVSNANGDCVRVSIEFEGNGALSGPS